MGTLCHNELAIIRSFWRLFSIALDGRLFSCATYFIVCERFHFSKIWGLLSWPFSSFFFLFFSDLCLLFSSFLPLPDWFMSAFFYFRCGSLCVSSPGLLFLVCNSKQIGWLLFPLHLGQAFCEKFICQIPLHESSQIELCFEDVMSCFLLDWWTVQHAPLCCRLLVSQIQLFFYFFLSLLLWNMVLSRKLASPFFILSISWRSISIDLSVAPNPCALGFQLFFPLHTVGHESDIMKDWFHLFRPCSCSHYGR